MKSAILIFLAVSLNAWNLLGYEMAVSITNTSLVYGQHQEYISDDFVDTYGYVNVYSGAKLRLWARDRVTLNPGFHAGSGSDFRAAVDANLDGISDMDEGVDSDGDGISDTLERSVGQDPFNATDSYVGDINGDGIFDRLTDVVSLDQTIGLEDLGIDGLAYSGFGGDLVVEAIPCYDYLLMEDPVTFAMWFVFIDLGDTMPSFYNFYVPPAYTLVQAGISGYAVRIIWDSESGKNYQIQKREDNDDQWTNFGSVLSGTGQDIIYTSSEQWYEWDDIGNQFRVVELGTSSQLVGNPAYANYLGSGGTEYLQNVSPEVSGSYGPNLILDLVYNNILTSGGIVPVVFPRGSSPTLANVRFLGIEIGLTGNGTLTVKFPTDVLGKLKDWVVALVYFEEMFINIKGFLPGPNGVEVSEVDEEDPDKLLLSVNDNFDERRRSQLLGQPREDWDDEFIDLSRDHDYARINLSINSSLSSGRVSLVSVDEIGQEQDLYCTGLRFFNSSGTERFTQLTAEVANLASTDLAGLDSSTGLTLLIESYKGIEDIVLRLKYERNGTSLYDDLHLHAVDIDISGTINEDIVDDDDENTLLPHRRALMVPLSGGSGSALVRVRISPTTLASRIEIDWQEFSGVVNYPPCGPFSNFTGDNNISINGNEVSFGVHSLEASLNTSSQSFSELDVDFVPRIPANPVEKVSIALWVVNHGTLRPSSGFFEYAYSESVLTETLQDTWTSQANVHLEIVQSWTPVEVAYDTGDGILSPSEYYEIYGGTVHPTADINVYLVKKISGCAGWTLSSTTKAFVFIGEEGEDPDGIYGEPTRYIFSHEIGHCLGLSSEMHDVEEHTEVFSALQIESPQGPDPKTIRRVDWTYIDDL